MIYRKIFCNMSRVDIDNPENFEVLITAANLPCYKEKLITIACYLPLNYPVPKGRAAVSYIEDVVIEVKRRFKDPFLVIVDDFN